MLYKKKRGDQRWSEGLPFAYGLKDYDQRMKAKEKNKNKNKNWKGEGREEKMEEKKENKSLQCV